MYAYTLCLLLASTGQVLAADEPAAPFAPQPHIPQTLAPPTFQPPAISDTPTRERDRSAPYQFGLNSSFGEAENDSVRIEDDDAPSISAIQTAQSRSAEGDASEALMQRVLREPARSAMEGKPLPLRSVVASSPSRDQQSVVVNAYWQLSKSLALYGFALDESDLLRGLPAPQAVHHQTLLTAEEASAKARCAAARVAVVRDQHALVETVPWESIGDAPLPSDPPFTGVYRTHFKVLNDQGAAPDRLGPIDRALPLMRESIDAQAEAVLADEDALNATRLAYQQGQATLGEVLEIYHALRHQRRTFLSSVYQYNEHIAQYAFSVSLPGASPDGIVGMLIETPDAQRSVLASKRSDSNIRRVSNEEEIDGWSPAKRDGS